MHWWLPPQGSTFAQPIDTMFTWILLITGIVLSSVYRGATERAFDRRLNLYLRTLIAEVATPDEPPGGDRAASR